MRPVCMVCKQLIKQPDQGYEKRVEYRGIRRQDRFRVRKVGDMCRNCVLIEVGEIKPEEQESLL